MKGRPRHRRSAFVHVCLAWCLAMSLGACASLPSGDARLAHAEQLAHTPGWAASLIATPAMNLRAWTPRTLTQADTLTIYIEGDGLSWVTSDQASDDPTPVDPIGLQLALRDPGRQAVYLARPCQYLTDAQREQACTRADWLEGRFSARLQQSMSAAVDVLKQRYAARQLLLIGYSGGGAMAALLAAQRHDVSMLITLAGNLDHRAWTQLHRLTPLTGSLNPADYIGPLTGVRQFHLVGDRDRNIAPELIDNFAAAFPAAHRPVVYTVAGFDHQCCWVAQWPAYWSAIMQRSKGD